MKKIIILIVFLISFSANVQEIKTTIEEVDTINLGVFEQEKVVRYTIGYVKICIAAQDYLDGVEVFYNRYKKWSIETKKGDSNYEFYVTNFRVIDSVFQTVKEQIISKDTVDVYQQTFDNIGLGSLVDFDKYIEKGECAIYNKNGIRQFKIIRKFESYYVGPLNAWGGRRFYLLNDETYFFEAADWVS